MGWFFRKYPSPPPPPPPLRKGEPCALCKWEIENAFICMAETEAVNCHGVTIESLPGYHIFIDSVNFCPICGRKLKEDPQ